MAAIAVLVPVIYVIAGVIIAANADRREAAAAAGGGRGDGGRRLMDQDLVLILPLICAIGTAIAVLVIDLILPGRQNVAIVVALLGLSVVSVATLYTNQFAGDAYGGAYRVDALTTFLDLLFVSIIALTIVFAPTTWRRAACRWPSSRSSCCSP